MGDGRTFKVECDVADAGVDMTRLKIDITDAYDVAATSRLTDAADLEIDTLNPTDVLQL